MLDPKLASLPVDIPGQAQPSAALPPSRPILLLSAANETLQLSLDGQIVHAFADPIEISMLEDKVGQPYWLPDGHDKPEQAIFGSLDPVVQEDVPVAADEKVKIDLTFKQATERNLSLRWAEASEWSSEHSLTLGFSPEAERIPDRVEPDSTWGSLGPIITDLVDRLGVKGAPKKAPFIQPLWETNTQVPDKMKPAIEYVAGFFQIFEPEWDRSMLDSRHPFSRGFREAGKRLLRALHFKDHLKLITTVFGDLNDDLRNTFAGLLKEQTSVMMVVSFLEELVRRFASVVVKSRRIVEVEHFWMPKRLAIIHRMLPKKTFIVEKKIKGKTQKESVTEIVTPAITGKSKMYLTANEALIVRKWNDGTSIPSWKLDHSCPLRFHEECEVARRLLEELQQVSLPTRKIIKARKDQIHRIVSEKIKTGDKGTYAALAADEMVKIVDNPTILSLRFEGETFLWKRIADRS